MFRGVGDGDGARARLLRCPCPFPCPLFPCLNIWISSWLFRRVKEAGLYSAEDLAMAGRGIILPESVIGQLLPADADEASREALNVIFDGWSGKHCWDRCVCG